MTARKVAIAALLVIGLGIPPAVIYFKDLHPVLILTPEACLHWVVHDATFNRLYKPGHTNLVCYVLGLGLGWVIYNLKESNYGVDKYKKYRVAHWLLMPAALFLQLTGAVFYDPEATVPTAVRLLYCSTVRLVSGTFMCLHLLLTVVSLGGLHTSLLNWRGWTPLGRLTFCVYLVHMSVIRFKVGFTDTTQVATGVSTILSFLECIIGSFLLAVPMFVLVETPFGQLTKMLFSRQEKHAD